MPRPNPFSRALAEARAGEPGPAMRPLERRQAVAAMLVVVVLFAGHLIFGANRNDAALVFSGAYGLLLATLMAVAPWARQDVSRTGGLLLPGLLFAAVIGLAVFSLLPAPDSLAHPLWRGTPGPPAVTIDRQSTLLAIVKLLGLASIFGVGVVAGAASARARLFLTLVTYGCAAYAAWAFWAFTTDPQHILGLERPYHASRLGASFFSANSAGLLFAMGSVLALTLAGETLRQRGRQLSHLALPLVALALNGVCLVLSASRGAIAAAALAAGVLLVGYALDRRPGAPRMARGPLALGALGLLGLFAWSSQTLIGRLMQSGGDLQIRREIVVTHLSAFQAHPWLGQGLGSFEAINRTLMTPDNFGRLWSVRAAHNVYLQWLEEAGVLGAAPMFLCVAAILAIIALRRQRRPQMAGWILGILAASLVPIVHGLIDYGLQVPSLAAFWACLLGVGYGLAMRRRAAPPARDYVAEARAEDARPEFRP